MRPYSNRNAWRLAALGAAGCLLFFTTPALASGGGAYWAGFKKFWLDFFGNPGGVVCTVLIVGFISLVIVTRVKGNKGS